MENVYCRFNAVFKSIYCFVSSLFGRGVFYKIKLLYRRLSIKRTFKRYDKAHKRVNHILSVYFGVPGSGKTTFAAYLTKKDTKYNLKVWSNVPLTGAYVLDPKSDIGNYMICDGRVIIDEAGIEYNNRDFKKFSEKQLYFYKYHRHYELAVDVFSQGYDDMDKKIRMLAQRLYVVSRSILPWFVYRRSIKKKVGINDLTKEICDEYYFVPFSRKYIFSPVLWKLFNTCSRESFPDKPWEKW